MASGNVDHIPPYDKPSYEYFRVDLFVSFALFLIAGIVYVLGRDIVSISILLTLMVLFFIRGTLGMYRNNRAKRISEDKK